MTDLSQSKELPVLTDRARLDTFNLLTAGCHHLWSKGKIQKDKVDEVLKILLPLTEKDPFFLSHLTSYVLKKSNIHDLHVLVTYANSLSQANGEPFSPGSKYKKPNLRYVSAAAIQMMEPKYVKRIIELCRTKVGGETLKEATHFPNFMRTAFKRYIKYREVNIEMMKGIKKAGLGEVMKNIYRILHESPSEEVAAILRWQQKNKKIEFEKPLFDFKDKTDLEIAKIIRKEKLPVLGVLGALKKISPVIAVALLEQCSGNQAVILRKTFEDQGVLNDKEVMALYESKIVTAKTALDRVDNIAKEASAAVKEVLKKKRSEVRKEQVGDIGKIYMHIDASGSMENAIEFATDSAAIIAECVSNPKDNFRWGLFGSHGLELKLPDEFVRDAFASMLYGFRPNGCTDIAALYPRAREFGSEVDVIISDGNHNVGYLDRILQNFHQLHPTLSKPKACVFIMMPNSTEGTSTSTLIKEAYEGIGVPVSVMRPSALKSSANVSEAVKTAIKGPMKTIDEIMEESLLVLPRWYYTI